MFEVIPPQRRANKETIAASVNKIKEAVKGLKSVNFLNVPEVAEENFAGMPLYKHVDNCEFASLLQKGTGIEGIANKVTPYIHSENEFKAWLKHSISVCNIHNFVFVGGSDNRRKYPGPPVIRANEITSKIKGVNFGNIFIQSRPDEVTRLIAKTESGTSFFTSQLVFEPGGFETVIEAYASACTERGMNPAVFYVSLAPASSQYDLEFFRWLGVNVPADVENSLKKSNEVVSTSIDIATNIFLEIKDFLKERGIKVDVSWNVESISNANLNAACDLVRALNSSL